MPSRIIREGILTSERVDLLSESAELFYRRLMSRVDDFGRFEATPRLLISLLYPLRSHKMTEKQISGYLDECIKAELIVWYESGGKAYLQMADFKQQVRSKDSKYPTPDAQQISNCEATAKQMKSNVHLDVVGVVDVIEDVSVVVIEQSAQPAKPPEKLSTGEVENPKPVDPDDFSDSKFLPGKIAALLRGEGIGVTATNPLIHAWVKAGKGMGEVIDAIGKARERKPFPETIPINYLNKIVLPLPQEERKTADVWWKDDKGIDRKAREMGITALTSDTYQTLKDKVFDAIKKREQETA